MNLKRWLFGVTYEPRACWYEPCYGVGLRAYRYRDVIGGVHLLVKETNGAWHREFVPVSQVIEAA